MPALADDRYTALLDGQLDDVAVQELLAAAGFTDWRAALRWLQQISDQDATRAALAACIPHLLAALATAASADTALVSFERFVRATANPHELLVSLHENPRMIEMLVMLFSGSQFLTEILLRNPEYFQRFAERRELAQPKTVAQLYTEAYLAVAPFTELDEQLNALRRFQRWELLRIGASDFFALFDLPTVTSQLSRLADALIQVCLTLAAWRSGLPMSGFAVIALGKLGGGELNYSSDIDLLFLARDDASVRTPGTAADRFAGPHDTAGLSVPRRHAFATVGRCGRSRFIVRWLHGLPAAPGTAVGETGPPESTARCRRRGAGA